MKKQQKFSIWYAILGVWAVFLVHNMIASAILVKSIPYSEFVQSVKEGKVIEIAISENDIRGRMMSEESGFENGVPFRTVWVDPEISQLLEESNVRYTGRIESNLKERKEPKWMQV